jgi:hypothetical protein
MPKEAHRRKHDRRKTAEHRIAAFLAKHQVDGEQDWDAKWISFRAVAQHCDRKNFSALRNARSTGCVSVPAPVWQ